LSTKDTMVGTEVPILGLDLLGIAWNEIVLQG